MVSAPPIVFDQVTLRHGAHDVVCSLSGTFAPGSMTALIGDNGAGKTTLLRALAGVHPIAAGSIDRGLLSASDIGLLPQGSQLDRGFPISCWDAAALGLFGRLGPFRAAGTAQKRAVDQSLDAVGMADQAAKPIGALSAGQFQRVLFARLILQDTKVILLDEPFSAVDAGTAIDLMAILLDWHREGRTIITVLHDLDLTRAHFHQALFLAGKNTVWGATGEVLKHAGTRRVGWSPRQAA